MSTDGDQPETQADARAVRRAAMIAASVLALLAGGIVAWQVVDRDGTSDELPTPADLSTGPVLEWTEVDLGLEDNMGILMPLGDGRVLVQFTGYFSENRTRLLVTVNGVDWAEVPMPARISPFAYDLSGDRWLVVGAELPGEPETFTDAPSMAPEGEEEQEEQQDEGGWAFPRQRVFFSDDRGTSWTELKINDSSDRQETSTATEFISAALTSGDHMVIVLQSENPMPVLDDDTSGTNGEWEGVLDQNPLSRIFASEGGAFEQVAAYNGWITGLPSSGNFTTPNGFSLGLLREESGRLQPWRLTSPDGRIWSEDTSADFWLWHTNAVGPDGLLWSAAWSENALNIQRVDQDGTRTTTATFSNLLPNGLVAGPSGLATMAATPIMPSGRVAKDGHELRSNEPEGSITLWDLSAGTAVYELGPEILIEGFPEGVREIEQPVDDENMDAVVLVFEDPETGDDLVSFTREELLPIPFFFLNTIEGSPQPECGWDGRFKVWTGDGKPLPMLSESKQMSLAIRGSNLPSATDSFSPEYSR